MEPLVPEWRTLGGTPERPQGPAATPTASGGRTVVLTTRTLGWVAGALIGAALVGAALCLVLLPGGGSVVIGAGQDEQASLVAGVTEPSRGIPATSASPDRDLVVDVEGAVRHPGLVHVPDGARVGDALALAGGFAPTADLARTATELNLAQVVSDGLKVIVPVMGQGGPLTATGDAGDATTGTTAATAAGAISGPVDLNHATEAQLDALPGVGPATIAKIVAARATEPFLAPDDLRSRGIVGEAAFAKLRDLVSVGR